ncbi:MAG: methyltransferase domain-containing protein [Candidatus Omnitrophica bacterium]|nr:methyltransferase domain-containing protein [Candidatus Omnitrophota bacterium]MBU4479744.1 methyltransferase domain-containing protein [Candidatus Omnitrophota bacterium]
MKNSVTDDIPSDKFEIQTTTVWSFPNRGKWLTHNAKYRGNWAPQIPGNLIRLYSKEGDTVLDPMVGSGTTMIEAKSLSRRGIGFDIHSEVVNLAQESCQFNCEKCYEPVIRQGDARDIKSIEDESIDLIATHPPYLNIIKYGTNVVDGDLSAISSLQKFCDEMEKIARECYRVLKPGKYCAILIGDTRRRRHYVPLAFSVSQRFLKAGFILKEDIIKVQHNCSTTRYWSAQEKDFLLIMHEHLFVFRKLDDGENRTIFKDSILSSR